MQFGAHPAGEGGEYETLTVDCPLFSSRINFVESEVIESEPEPFPVAYLRISKAELEPKEGWVKPTVPELRELLELDTDEAGQEGLNEKGLEVLEAIGSVDAKEDDPSSVAEQLSSTTLYSIDTPHRGVRFGRRGSWFAVSAEGQSAGRSSVKEEVVAALDAVKGEFQTSSFQTDTRTTEGREAVSAAAFDTHHAPPLFHGPVPRGQRRLRAVLRHLSSVTSMCRCPSSRRRADTSRSRRLRRPGGGGPRRWTNCSPRPGAQLLGTGQHWAVFAGCHCKLVDYCSEADVQVNSRLHIAGQIPLQPPSLTFAPYPPTPASPYPHQAALALQHVERIIDVLRNPNSTGGGWTGWVESCVCWWARPSGLGSEGPEVAQKAWKAWAEEVSCSVPMKLTSRTTVLVRRLSSCRPRSSRAARSSSTRSTRTLADQA